MSERRPSRGRVVPFSAEVPHDFRRTSRTCGTRASALPAPAPARPPCGASARAVRDAGGAPGAVVARVLVRAAAVVDAGDGGLIAGGAIAWLHDGATFRHALGAGVAERDRPLLQFVVGELDAAAPVQVIALAEAAALGVDARLAHGLRRARPTLGAEGDCRGRRSWRPARESQRHQQHGCERGAQTEHGLGAATPPTTHQSGM